MSRAGRALLLLLALAEPVAPRQSRKARAAASAGGRAQPAPGLPRVPQAEAAVAGRSESELYSVGTDHLTAERLPEALAAFDLAVAASRSGGRTNTRVNRGLTLMRLGRMEEALEAFDGALAIDGRFLYALYNKGLTLRKMGRVKEAVVSLQVLLPLPPRPDTPPHPTPPSPVCLSLRGVWAGGGGGAPHLRRRAPRPLRGALRRPRPQRRREPQPFRPDLPRSGAGQLRRRGALGPEDVHGARDARADPGRAAAVSTAALANDFSRWAGLRFQTDGAVQKRVSDWITT